MPDSTLAALTAATPATGGLFYGIQSGGDRKFTLSAAGAAIAEAASAADQRTALGAASTSDLGGKLNLTGGTLTGAICMPEQAGGVVGDMRSKGFVFGSSAATAASGIGGYASSLFFWSYSSLAAVLTNTQLGLPSAGVIGWGPSSAVAGKDTLIGRGGAATLQLGQNHASTPTAQTIKAHNVTTGTGASLEIAGGTGSVARGNVTLNGGNRSAYIASPSTTQIRDILISHGLMAAS